MYLKQFVVGILVFACFTGVMAQKPGKAEAEKTYTEAETLRKTRKADAMREALVKYQSVIPIFNKLGMRKREADSYNNIGYIYRRLGKFEDSISHLEKSLKINREIKNTNGQAISLLNMAQALRFIGKREKAVSSVNEAITISKASGNKQMEASGFNELGVIYYRSGEIEKASEQFEKAAKVFEALGKPMAQASILNNIALINRIYGHQEKAIETYHQALKIFQELEKQDGEADVSLNLAVAYKDTFKNSEAIKYTNRALTIFRKQGDRQREAVVLNNIAVFYNDLGDYSKAQYFYNQSAEIAKEIDDKRQYTNALKNMGILQMNLNQTEKALETLNTALKLNTITKDRKNEGLILTNLGDVYQKKGDLKKSEETLEKAMEILRSVGDREGIARALFIFGTTLYAKGDKQAALPHFQESLEIRRKLLSPLQEAKVLLGIARIERDLGDLLAARKTIEEAIKNIEELRIGVPGQELRTYYFALGKDAYEFYVDLLMQMDETDQSFANRGRAFETSERSRARSLLEILYESRTEIRQGVDANLLKREHFLQNRLNARERHRANLIRKDEKPENLEAVEKEINMLLTEYEQTRAQIRKESSNYAALIYPKPLTLEEIQQELLDKDTALLEYFVGETRSYAWLITKDSVKSYKLPDVAKIHKATNQLFKSIIRENGSEDNASSIDANLALSKMIIQPFAEELNRKRLVIVANGPLQDVPFSALLVSSGEKTEQNQTYQPLIARLEVVNLPSASTLAVIRKRTPKKNIPLNSIAIVADPVFSESDPRVAESLARLNYRPSTQKAASKNKPKSAAISELNRSASDLNIGEFRRLKFSRKEADSIASMVPKTKTFKAVDFAADRDFFLQEDLSKYQILHFATHGLLNNKNPELSGIVFSLVDESGNPKDGFLRLHDIFNMEIGAKLVVLSACQTALGKEVEGEGLIGLTRGFMYAGADSVVASLWKVEDRATSILMKKFYRALLKEGQKPAAALRTAQLEMWRDPQWSDPYYWAGFTIQGEWK